MVSFLKKNAGTLVLLVLLALLFIPQTGTPIRIFFNRLIAFSPTEIAEEDRMLVSDYTWRLMDLQGSTINFEEAEGKVVVLNIWATWCPPCIAEMPSFEKLYKDYGSTVAFYFVSTEDVKTLQRFIDKKAYTFPVYTTQYDFPVQLQTNTFPTTYVISKAGEIVMNKKGAADWNSESVRNSLDRLLAK